MVKATLTLEFERDAHPPAGEARKREIVVRIGDDSDLDSLVIQFKATCKMVDRTVPKCQTCGVGPNRHDTKGCRVYA